MALLFSAVTVTAGNEEIEFTVGGIPREYDDLVGWTAFDDFMENADAETEVSVHAEAYLYGGEETVTATPEEVAYLICAWNGMKTSCQGIATISRMSTSLFYSRRTNITK